MRPGGREVWASLTVSAVVGPDGAARYVIAQMIDISDQHAAEVALADSERRFRTLAVASPVGIFAAAADGRMMYANARMAEIFGCSVDQLDAAVWIGGGRPGRPPLLDRPAGRCRREACRSARGRAGPVVRRPRWVRVDMGGVAGGDRRPTWWAPSPT